MLWMSIWDQHFMPWFGGKIQRCVPSGFQLKKIAEKIKILKHLSCNGNLITEKFCLKQLTLYKCTINCDKCEKSLRIETSALLHCEYREGILTVVSEGTETSIAILALIYYRLSNWIGSTQSILLSIFAVQNFTKSYV